MTYISVTRLRLRSPLSLPLFLWANERSVGQVRRAAGFKGGVLFVDARRAFWTATAWEDEAAMRAFRNADAHRSAMPKLLDWCDEAAVAHWTQETDDLPDWREARRRILGGGKFTKVKRPSEDHLARRITEPRLPPRTQRPLRPMSR